jgi:5-formyltetrahydrofolate cyclo-ligase
MPDFARDAERSRSTKLALRNRVITARKALPEAVRRSAAASVQASTLSWVRQHQPTRCAAYVPVGTEPGGPGLVDALAGATSVLLPILLPDGDLDWAEHHGDLRRTARGLLEPSGPALGPDAVADVDLILVPALAVARSTGMRLGRGGGSYDRALARAAGRAFSVALLHDGELLDDVPSEPHDRPIDAAITPAEGLTATPDWTK